MIALSILLFFIGLFFGSFFLVIIDRLPRSKSPLSGRSHCDFCNHVLSPFDLIPVFSYLSLNGKCRYCKARLSAYYPAVELLTAVLFAVTPFILMGSPLLAGVDLLPALLFSLFVIATFIIIFIMDLKYGLIPFAIVFPAIFISLIYTAILKPDIIVTSLITALLAGLFFYLIHAATRGRGMGFGDVILVLYLGILVGFPSIVTTLYIAFLTGAVVSLILIISKRKRLKNSTIPFGPFLVFGAFISYFWGEKIFDLVYQYLLLGAI